MDPQQESMDIVVERPIHEEGILPRIFEGKNATFPGNCTLMQYFQSGLKNEKRIDPLKIAIIDDELVHTFEQLDETSARLAQVLKSILLQQFKNLNPDHDLVIGVCIPPSDKLVITLFAILKMGAAYLPYEVSFPEDRVVKITNNARPVLVICDHHSNVESKFDSVQEITRVFNTQELFAAAEALEVEEEDGNELRRTKPWPTIAGYGPEQTAIVLYTSGSSGEPKGVRLSHRAVLNRLQWQWDTFPFNAKNGNGEEEVEVIEERSVLKTSLTFVDSVAEIFAPLLQGVTLVTFPKTVTSVPNIFIQKLSQYKITRLILVPSLLKAMFNTIRLIEGTKILLENVKLWVCSGEALTKDLLNEFFEHFPKGYTICNFYGSTEIMADVTYVSFSNQREVYLKTLENAVPIGTPVSNTVIYVLDEELQMCYPGEMGEIYVGGYNLCKGYVGLYEDIRFIHNPFSKTTGFHRLYKTGDFGRIVDNQGKERTLAFEGRVDSQLKVRGQRVDLSEIEAAIASIYLIAKCKVLCYHPGLEDQTIVAFIVQTNEAHFDRIKTLVDMKLRDYERPVLRLIKDIPLLVNGKTDRQRLLKIFEQDLENRTNFVNWNSLDLPEGKEEVAKIVLTTMSEVTGTSIEEIAENLSNSFYNVGGSSLNSIEVIVRLRKKSCYITIPEFVGSKTIRDIIICTVVSSSAAASLKVSAYAEKIYTTSLLADKDKEEACHIIAHSFSHHGDLEQYTSATYDDFQALVRSIWHPLVEKGFSFIIRRKQDGTAVGVALNFDVYDEPDEEDVVLCKDIGYVFEMLEFIESRQREKLPKGKGKLIHSFMMGTFEDIDESENVFIIQFMEEKIIRMAGERNFLGVLTTNTNALTQQIAQEIHGYEVLFEYQVNRFLADDDATPFVLAPDSFKIVCCWKKVDQTQFSDYSISSSGTDSIARVSVDSGSLELECSTRFLNEEDGEGGYYGFAGHRLSGEETTIRMSSAEGSKFEEEEEEEMGSKPTSAEKEKKGSKPNSREKEQKGKPASGEEEKKGSKPASAEEEEEKKGSKPGSGEGEKKGSKPSSKEEEKKGAKSISVKEEKKGAKSISEKEDKKAKGSKSISEKPEKEEKKAKGSKSISGKGKKSTKPAPEEEEPKETKPPSPVKEDPKPPPAEEEPAKKVSSDDIVEEGEPKPSSAEKEPKKVPSAEEAKDKET